MQKTKEDKKSGLVEEKKDELVTATFDNEQDFQIEDKTLMEIGHSTKILYSEEYHKKEGVWAAAFPCMYSKSPKGCLNLATGDLLGDYADDVLVKAKDLIVKIIIPDSVEKIDEGALIHLICLESPIVLVAPKKVKRQLKQILKNLKGRLHSTSIAIEQKEPTLFDRIIHRKRNEESLTV